MRRTDFATGAALAALLLTAPAFAADPGGRYDVQGSNPGGSGSYTGDVTVSQTGQTWNVTWVVGRDTFIGTGIGNDDFLAVTYRSGNSTGLALYSAEGPNWVGIWTTAGGRELGQERWTRR